MRNPTTASPLTVTRPDWRRTASAHCSRPASLPKWYGGTISSQATASPGRSNAGEWKALASTALFASSRTHVGKALARDVRHSVRVRLRCATLQARAAHAVGSTFQMTPMPERKPAITCFPSGKNVPHPPMPAPGSGAPISSRDSTSQSRNLPSPLTVARVFPRGSNETLPTRAVVTSQRPTDRRRGAQVPESDIAGIVAGGQQLAVRREPERVDRNAMFVIIATSSRLAIFQTEMSPARPAAATSFPSGLKSTSTRVPWATMRPVIAPVRRS